MSELGAPPLGPTEEEKKAAVQRLRKEINILTVEQNQARKMAAYGGMTPEETKKYDSCRDRIAMLSEKLLQFEKSLAAGHS
jgi:hypothetical protein